MSNYLYEEEKIYLRKLETKLAFLTNPSPFKLIKSQGGQKQFVKSKEIFWWRLGQKEPEREICYLVNVRVDYKGRKLTFFLVDKVTPATGKPPYIRYS